MCRVLVTLIVIWCCLGYFQHWQDWDSREKCVIQIDQTGGMGDACDELTPTQRESAQTLFDWGWANYTDATRPEWIH